MINRVDLNRIKNILVVRLDEIGDLVLTTPLLRELRRNAPQARITLLVKPQTADLVKNCPYVNRVLTYDWQVSQNAGIISKWTRALKFSLFNLWGEWPDLAILPRWDVDFYRASYLMYFSLASIRVGYSERVTERKARMNKGYNKLFTDLISDISLKHEVERSLDVVRFLGGKVEDDRLELWLTEEDRRQAREIVQNLRLPGDGPLVCFCVDAESLKKKWPIENYHELGRRLSSAMRARILILGENRRSLRAAVDDVFCDYPVANFIGKTTLSGVCALIKECWIYVGNDTGLKHIASAMKIPVVEISCWPRCGSPFSEYGPYRFTPWKSDYITLYPERPISPCNEECVSFVSHCIAQVTVDHAEEAARKMLACGQGV